MKDNKQLNSFGNSDMGRQRTNNEDAFILEKIADNVILAAVIDGVGGYEGGEVAADIAKTEITEYLKNFSRGERIELLKQAVASANNKIYERRQIDENRRNMSCVLTSAIIDADNKMVNMVHVGDTRLYQFNNGELTKLSHDHSLVGYREEVGDLTEEEAMHHPQRNVIGRDVGSQHHDIGDPDFIEANQFQLLPNSIYMFCSDGLTDLITSAHITEILRQDWTVEEKTYALIDAANNAGGKDNITVVLVEYLSNEKIIQPEAVNYSTPIVETIETPMQNKPRKKRRGMFSVILILLLLAMGGVGYYLYENYDFSFKPQPQENVIQQPSTTEDAIETSTPEVDDEKASFITVEDLNNKPKQVKEGKTPVLSDGMEFVNSEIGTIKIIKSENNEYEILIDPNGKEPIKAKLIITE